MIHFNRCYGIKWEEELPFNPLKHEDRVRRAAKRGGVVRETTIVTRDNTCFSGSEG
jgi:hypothetical protein